MTVLSVLDLSPIKQGGDAADAWPKAWRWRSHAEALGYRRYWLAEHHNMPGIASAPPPRSSSAMSRRGTKTIRVGAGGIMLPNHAPLMIAEQFGTLAALYPGRIDLGLGRAPGTDPAHRAGAAPHPAGRRRQFPAGCAGADRLSGSGGAGAPVRAVPGEGTQVPVWILGSSHYGAQLAAALGLPYAFASHFAPDDLEVALELYRRDFPPVAASSTSRYVMLGLNVFAADSDDEAQFLFTSLQQAFVNLRTGRPGPLPPPLSRLCRHAGPAPGRHAGSACCAAPSWAGRETVKPGLEHFIARHQPDEIMVTAQIFDRRGAAALLRNPQPRFIRRQALKRRWPPSRAAARLGARTKRPRQKGSGEDEMTLRWTLAVPGCWRLIARRRRPGRRPRPRPPRPPARRPSPGPPSPPSCRPISGPTSWCGAWPMCWPRTRASRAGTQEVFLSRDFQGDWISMAPGEKTKTQFYADDRVFWVVQSGQMKVTIEGQEPFIASKHFLVQVPKRLQYSMETVGSEPVLFFQMKPAGESPDYPLSETPTPVKGVQYIQAAYSGHGDYDKINHPYIDFEKQIVQGGEKTGVWIRDDHTFVTILRSQRACRRRPTLSGAISTPTSRKSG